MSKVIQQIAEIQIEALTQIVKNPSSVDHEDLCKYLQIKDEEIVEAAENLIHKYRMVLDEPRYVAFLSEYQLMVCSHILFQIEDELIMDDPIAVNRAWDLIIDAQKKFHPELRIVINNL